MLQRYKPDTLLLFLSGILPALLLALFTDHVWEDWNITYRASKNLAMGSGLVFEPGQFVHTFTSPINALLPAALSWLLDNHNDQMVVWLYRLVSLCCLGVSILLLHRIALHENFKRHTIWFMIGLFIIDGKTMDFSINGQEAAFLVLFHAFSICALIEKNFIWLGIAWAGLMWSRPDSFIYIAITAMCYVLSSTIADRRLLFPLLKLFLKSAIITVFLYGPWTIWTTWYYGTPLPHTIVAKGLGTQHPLSELIIALLRFPIDIWFNTTTIPSLFMPTYFLYGGWPQWMIVIARILGCIAAMSWLLPKVSPLTRSCSLAVFIGLFYLDRIAPIAFPWYFSPIMILTVICLAGVMHTISMHFSKNENTEQIIKATSTLILTVWLLATLMLAWQIRIQQVVIENSHRKQIGLWLKEQAGNKHETVFTECLGYIGFYSNLKMYDFPGMSSPEMVAARRIYGNDWAMLIKYLQPDWLVLRPREAREILARDQQLLNNAYTKVRVFNQSETLKRYWFLPGRQFLEHDQVFLIYRKQSSTS